MKLWGGRFLGKESRLMEEFNSSLHVDKVLYKQDIRGSIAHLKMLVRQNLLTNEEGERLINGLVSLLKDIEEGKLKIEGIYEDIHSFIEINLVDRVGEVGKKLHTARSRNDQVAVDTKLYAKEKAFEIINDIKDLMDTIKTVADANEALMPGYTHLQAAQVITFKHHIMAYYYMLERDIKRILNAIEIMNESPLGCCALAGTTFEIDREYTALELGFKKPVENFLDGVSDRDYIIELISAFSIIMMHLSRLSEELIIWSSQEFKFVEMDDAYTTGSSIMPQKKNPDAAELIRGKTGRVYGALISILTLMKGLPLAYNKDMQEDKEQFFDAIVTVQKSIIMMKEVIATLKINKGNMLESIKKGFLNATEIADYLVNKGLEFRNAHKISGQIVVYCEKNNKLIEDLNITEFKMFSDLFEMDIYDFIAYDNIISKGIKIKMK
ncbi:argininosuccinate lyase [Fervidicella metallireducens AeB]|uniref:Argininosuccinate lyase n=1 Tax=Fervidicella metallireducens AeB TaxID=1403537 RepID=A0A017RVM3_9CLOT|nr:argininosuccinate lyase [Fervidicella metallireducens]EYE88449.1 argininosuccinate lyase [Fervidicella metallireducens AeB]